MLKRFFPASLIPFYMNVAGSIFTQSIALLISLTGSIILARSLGAEGRGIVAWAIYISSIAIVAAQLGLPIAAKKIVARHKEQASTVYFLSLAIALTTSLVSMAIVYFVSYKNPIAQDNNDVLIIALIFIPFSVLAGIHGEIILGMHKIKSYNILGISEKIINTGLIILFFLYGVLTPYIAALFLLISTAARLVITQFLFPQCVFRPKIDPQIFTRGNIGFTFHNYIASLANVLSYCIVPISIGYYSNAEEVGIFFVARILFDVTMMIPGIYTSQIVPKITSERAKGNSAHYKKHLLFMIGFLMSAIAILLFFVSEWIVNIAYGSDFYKSATCLKIMAPGILFYSIYATLYSFTLSETHGKLISLFPALFTFCSLLLILFLKEQFDSINAAKTVTISSFIIMVSIVFYYIKVTHYKRV